MSFDEIIQKTGVTFNQELIVYLGEPVSQASDLRQLFVEKYEGFGFDKSFLEEAIKLRFASTYLESGPESDELIKLNNLYSALRTNDEELINPLCSELGYDSLSDLLIQEFKSLFTKERIVTIPIPCLKCYKEDYGPWWFESQDYDSSYYPASYGSLCIFLLTFFSALFGAGISGKINDEWSSYLLGGLIGLITPTLLLEGLPRTYNILSNLVYEPKHKQVKLGKSAKSFELAIEQCVSDHLISKS